MKDISPSARGGLIIPVNAPRASSLAKKLAKVGTDVREGIIFNKAGKEGGQVFDGHVVKVSRS